MANITNVLKTVRRQMPLKRQIFIPLGYMDQKLNGWINLFLVLKAGHSELLQLKYLFLEVILFVGKMKKIKLVTRKRNRSLSRTASPSTLI